MRFLFSAKTRCGYGQMFCGTDVQKVLALSLIEINDLWFGIAKGKQ